MKLRILNNVLLVLISLLFFNCGTKENKQNYVDEYTTVLTQFMTRNEIIKKGKASIIAYRRSNFMDIDNAENAKNSFIQSIKLDSAALQHLSEIDIPGPAEKEISELLYSGIESICKGTTISASNYSKAKEQNYEQRKSTIMDVQPSLIYIAKGLNSIVISLNNIKDYIKDNGLEEDVKISAYFNYFETERDNLKSFLKE